MVEDGLILRREDEWHFEMERFLSLQEIAVERAKNYPYQRQSSPAQRRLKVIVEMLDADGADWVQSISEDFPVFLISDQRLTVAERAEGRFGPPRPPRPINQPIVAVNEFARDMRRSITQTLNRYAKVSQSLDEAFYHKVIEALDGKVELDELRDLLARVNAVAAELRRVGLLADEQELAADAERLEAEAVRPVIKTFAEDTLEKYEVLRPLQLQLESFISFLDKHYQNKKVEIDQEKGFVVRLDDESILSPSKLSSGEQQMLSMAYQLLFKARPGTLVLIDEPELSLHVTWQQSLVEDLGTLGKGRSLSFLLASHSPTVIGDRPELMRSLDP
jgi:ABC-type dipeptide/oligopeptide/nickel transport system ATPase subunit